MKNDVKKSLIITFCGAPNVGKSTLLNTLMNLKLSICSPKPQTTRYSIRGILTKDNTQLVFVDTPGIFKPKVSQLERQIVKEAWQGFCGADLICLIIDGQIGIDKNVMTILEKTKKNNTPMIAVINKSDLMTFDEKIFLAEKLWKMNRFIEIFSLSAKKNKGCNELMQYFVNNSKIRDWMFEEDEITDKDSNFLSSEFVREQLFLILQKELPYMLTCETDFFKDDGEKINISVVVKIGKKNHKKIILGENGGNLKKIIRKASLNLEKLFEKPIKLKLFIKQI